MNDLNMLLSCFGEKTSALPPSLASRLRLERGCLPSPLPLQARKEATQVGKKIICGMAHGPSLQRGGEGGGECTIHLEYFLPEGEKGRPQPSSQPAYLLSLPVDANAATAAWSIYSPIAKEF